MAVVDVEFDASAYTLEALNAAAYRLIGVASCQIQRTGQSYLCRLTPAGTDVDQQALRHRFNDLVTDECVRERLRTKTEPYRNLILSLAFGALASDTPKQP